MDDLNSRLDTIRDILIQAHTEARSVVSDFEGTNPPEEVQRACRRLVGRIDIALMDIDVANGLILGD